MNHTIQTFTLLVHKMRLAQERYFELAMEARKTGRHPKEKKDALVIAKNLEKQVDAAINDINQERAFTGASSGINTNSKVIFRNRRLLTLCTLVQDVGWNATALEIGMTST